MENLIGKWGGTSLQNISWNNQSEFIHPEDWDKIKDYKYIKSLHKCVAIDSNFLVIEFGETKIRISDSIFFPFEFTPKFHPLEKVKTINSKGLLEFGIITGIHWHNNDRKFYYDVEVNNKIKGRRYYSEDLENNEM